MLLVCLGTAAGFAFGRCKTELVQPEMNKKPQDGWVRDTLIQGGIEKSVLSVNIVLSITGPGGSMIPPRVHNPKKSDGIKKPTENSGFFIALSPMCSP